jgi:DNA-binding MarR family transcriptional regulator
VVKQLDDSPVPLIDHVGWRLWQVARMWKIEFERRVSALGYGWLTEARASLIYELRSGEAPQAALSQRLGISKQAVQQAIDELAAEGAVERIADLSDRRGRIVRLTVNGRRALMDANATKTEIEAEYRSRLGEKRFATLMAALGELAKEK